MGIKHKSIVTHGQKGLATEWNDDHEIDGDVECEHHQHVEHVIENRTNWPAGPVEGQIIYRTDLNQMYTWDGAAWQVYVYNPLIDDLDFDQHEALNFVLENVNAMPGGPIEGQALWRADLNIGFVYTGTAWEQFTGILSGTPVLLDETTLGAPALLISVAGLTTTDYDRLVIVLASEKVGDAGNNRKLEMRFNNDGGANYDWQFLNENAALTSAVADVTADIGFVRNTTMTIAKIEVTNLAASEKTGITKVMETNLSTGGIQWNNTAAKINRVDIWQGGGINFAAGSKLSVYGIRN